MGAKLKTVEKELTAERQTVAMQKLSIDNLTSEKEASEKSVERLTADLEVRVGALRYMSKRAVQSPADQCR